MINLLPDDHKRDIRAARMNVVLLRYNFLMFISFLSLLAICAIFYVVLSTNQSSAVSKNSDNSAKAASFQAVRTAADDYRNNLSIANKVLGNSVNYTSVIFEITELLPAGVILDSLTLNATDFGQQTTFSAHAKSYAQATELKESFEKSKLFTNVYFQNITDSASGEQPGAYPVAVSLSAKLNEATAK